MKNIVTKTPQTNKPIIRDRMNAGTTPKNLEQKHYFFVTLFIHSCIVHLLLCYNCRNEELKQRLCGLKNKIFTSLPFVKILTLVLE